MTFLKMKNTITKNEQEYLGACMQNSKYNENQTH